MRDLELVASFRRVKAREGSRLATLGVVRARGARLREELEEADEEDNLPLARLRDLVPQLRGRLGGVVTGDVDGELHAVRVEAVADEAGHRDAAVLDLGVAQPADRRRVALVPEVRLREVQWVPEAHGDLLLVGETDEVGLGLAARLSARKHLNESRLTTWSPPGARHPGGRSGPARQYLFPRERADLAIMVVEARALTAPVPATGVGAKLGKAERLASMMSKGRPIAIGTLAN